MSDLVNNDVDGRPLSPSQRVPQLIRHLQLNMYIDDEKMNNSIQEPFCPNRFAGLRGCSTRGPGHAGDFAGTL